MLWLTPPTLYLIYLSLGRAYVDVSFCDSFATCLSTLSCLSRFVTCVSLNFSEVLLLDLLF